MSAGDDSAERAHEPTERRLADARRRGEVARGRDLFAAAAFAGLLLAGVMAGKKVVLDAAMAGMVLLDQADRIAPLVFGAGASVIGGLGATLGAAAAPLFLVPLAAVIAMIVAQRACVIAPGKIAPKLSRISPIQGAKNKFGTAGLFEFAKSFVKLCAVAIGLWIFLTAQSDRILGTIHASPGAAAHGLVVLLGEFLLLVVTLQAAIGGLDLAWQHAEHRRRNRMTRRELLDEMKESEGDPHLKAARRHRATEIATGTMLADVATADVVIVNPTHYAVALAWKRGERGAPICVAKGVDEIAARIRERAALAGVPMRHDPPCARALHATVGIGEAVRPEHFRAVAAAIRFADAVRRRARSRVRQT
ncbi:MAG: flagellar biosynthesis protein FlhB [Gemmobacter sp.]